LEYRSSEGYDERFAALAAALVAMKVEVIIASTVPAIRAAQRATTTTPIVMVLSSDPVRLGLVTSLARPGANTTGPAALTFNLAPKRLELFKEMISKLRQVAVLYNPTNPAVREGATQTQIAGRSLGVEVRSFEVREHAHLDTAFAAILRTRLDGLLVVPDPLVSTYTAQIVDFAEKKRLPSMWGFSEAARIGGLIAFGIDYVEHVRVSLRPRRSASRSRRRCCCGRIR
jgi:putative tryptophan/tyrosine transport system substrate-binding protein